jgi:hypothetical protein
MTELSTFEEIFESAKKLPMTERERLVRELTITNDMEEDEEGKQPLSIFLDAFAGCLEGLTDEGVENLRYEALMEKYGYASTTD